jgi:hypothetical protein
VNRRGLTDTQDRIRLGALALVGAGLLLATAFVWLQLALRPQGLAGLQQGASAAVVENEGHKFRVNIGLMNEAGAPGEIFVNAHRVDSTLDSLAGDIAILISLLLQHGATAAAIGHALRRNPNGSRASLAGVLVDRVAAHEFAAVDARAEAAE